MERTEEEAGESERANAQEFSERGRTWRARTASSSLSSPEEISMMSEFAAAFRWGEGGAGEAEEGPTESGRVSFIASFSPLHLEDQRTWNDLHGLKKTLGSVLEDEDEERFVDRVDIAKFDPLVAALEFDR